MPKKSAEELIEELAVMTQRGFQETQEQMAKQFDQVAERFTLVDHRLDRIEQRLDRVEFLLIGQDGRLSALEDKMRQVATRIGIAFN